MWILTMILRFAARCLETIHPGAVLLLAVALGMLAGVGVFTFVYAEGFSYFSSDPKACVNCHIMRDEYDSWQKSSHHAVAVCVDCHLPKAFVPKMIAKSDNGWRHSKAFTLQNFHEPIQITWRNSKILQDNCERCHGELVSEMLQRGPRESDRADCVKCHSYVGHAAKR